MTMIIIKLPHNWKFGIKGRNYKKENFHINSHTFVYMYFGVFQYNVSWRLKDSFETWKVIVSNLAHLIMLFGVLIERF